MANALKCPNTTCPYLFDPTGVPTGVVLNCPRCGMRFTLGPPAPVAPPTPDTPPAIPSPRSAPPPEPRQPPHEAPLPPADPSESRMTIFWVVFTLAILLGAGLMVYFQVFHQTEPPPTETAAKLKSHNVALDPPGVPWVRDEVMREKMGFDIILVYKRTDPEAYMAFGAKDHVTRKPRPSELRAGLDGPLSRVFPPETLRMAPFPGGGKWLGRDATLAFSFEAQGADGGRMKGECLAVSEYGISYWSICWASEMDFPRVVEEFDAHRGRFKLLNLRDNWQPQESGITTFGGHGFDYRILDGEGLWTEKSNPQSEVPPADLHLIASVKRPGAKRLDPGQEAELWVYAIDAKGDPLKQARGYVEGLRTEELKGADAKYVVSFQEQTQAPEGDPPVDTVDTPAPVVRLKSTVEGVSSQSRLIVVRAQCEWKDRETFETKMIQIAGSLRAGK